MKKILMILDKKFPADIRVEKEAESLIKAGYEVHLACLSFEEDYLKEEEINDIKIHRKYINSITFKSSVGCLKFPLYFQFWKKFVLEILQKNKFDYVHIHDLPLAKIGLFLKKKFRLKFILDLHENWPAYLRISRHANTFLGKILSSDSQWISYEEKMVKKADKVICVVDEAKERLLKFSQKIEVVSNTVEIENYEKFDHNDQLIHIIYAGGITEHRGLDVVLNAISRIKDVVSNVRLDILGDGSYLENLKQLSKNLNIEDFVTFYGWVNFTDAQRMVNSADIALIPHRKSDHTDSTIPHKLFQYMYQKLPVISSNCLPIERILKETESGKIYKWDSDEELSEIFIELINDKNLRRNLGENGYKAVIKKYNWNEDSKRLNSIYNGV